MAEYERHAARQKKQDRAFDDVQRVIDEVTDPEKMSKTAYKEFLEQLMSDLEGRLDGVTRELEEDGDG